MQEKQVLKRRWNELVYILFKLITAMSYALVSANALAGLDNARESLLAVELNQFEVSRGALVLQETEGMIWVQAEDLRAWRIRAPGAGSLYDGRFYYRLGDLAGVSFRLDAVRQTLILTARPEALLAATSVSLARSRPVLSPRGAGGFLNYDLFGRIAPDSSGEGAQFELGVFNRWGVGLNTFAFEEGRAGGQGIRLETAWIRDWPDRLGRLQIGDSLSRTASLFGGVARFAGVQYGTNFATQPQLITTPLQRVSGETALPSVAEIYVNNNLVQRRDIPAGGFSITDIPAISGSGEVTVVVKDILGREQVITRPFYSSPVLLAKGLSDFSLEAGVQRENFAKRSADYGSPLASATWRKGLANDLTAEAHGEWTKHHVNLGLGGIWLAPGYGVLGAGLAVSSTNGGEAGMGTLTYEYSQRGFSLGGRQQWAGTEYRQLGLGENEMLPARQTNVFGGLSLGKAGNVALAWFRQDKRGEQDSEFVTLSYQLGLPRRVTLLLNYLQTLTGEKAKAATLSLSFPFGERSTASYQHRNDLKRADKADVHYLTLQQSLPAGEGWGWRVQVADREENDLGLAYQGRYGTYGMDILQRSEGASVNLLARGGLGWVSGKLFASRTIDESFGLVEVPGLAGVRVYAENQLMGKTGEDGKLLLTQLRAYEENDIRIDPRDLPLDADIETLRQKIAPHFRSGTHAIFPVRRLRPALLTLVLEDGRPLPSGARLTKAGTDAYYPVGKDGLVYVDNMDDETELVANYPGGQCRARVAMPPTAGPQPDLGQHICRGFAP